MARRGSGDTIRSAWICIASNTPTTSQSADRRKAVEGRPLSKPKAKRAARKTNRADEIAAENIRLQKIAIDLLLQIDVIREAMRSEDHQPAAQ